MLGKPGAIRDFTLCYLQHTRNKTRAFNYGNTLLVYKTLAKHVKVLFEQLTPLENVDTLYCGVPMHTENVLCFRSSYKVCSCCKRVLNDLLQKYQSSMYMFCVYTLRSFYMMTV